MSPWARGPGASAMGGAGVGDGDREFDPVAAGIVMRLKTNNTEWLFQKFDMCTCCCYASFVVFTWEKHRASVDT